MSTSRWLAGNATITVGNLSEGSSLTEPKMTINIYLLVSVEYNTEGQELEVNKIVSNLQLHEEIVGSWPEDIS